MDKKSILHICQRETLRPIRDQILRNSGYAVESTASYQAGLERFHAQPYDLILIDVENEAIIEQAERLCSAIKDQQHSQLVAFVCDLRIALQTSCPDEILRTEFDPAAFVAGVHHALIQA